MKKCTKCLTEKQIGDFYNDKTKRDGKGSHCKDCTIKRHKNIFHGPKVELSEKKCTSCKNIFPISEFHIDAYTPTGRARRCKECEFQWRASRPVEKKRDIWLKMKYKISHGEYVSMLEKQCGCCAICGRSQESLGRSLCVDHCHSTGKIRGLLCVPCNGVLGRFGDSSDRFLSAFNYLKNHEQFGRLGEGFLH